MAKILYGGGVANMSGSVGGTVHSHNQFGSYTRNRVVPTNPQTANQTLARSRLSSVAQAWREQTDAIRADWAALGAQIVRTDPLGQTYTLKGFNAFCLINMHSLAVGGGLVTAAPALDQAPVPTIGAINVSDTPVFTIAYTAVGGTADNSFEIWASAPVSAGRNFINPSLMKKVKRVPGNSASPINITTEYANLFGDVLLSGSDERVFLEFRPFSANGIPGPVVRGSAIIQHVFLP